MFESISNIIRCATFCTGDLEFKIIPKSLATLPFIHILWLVF